MACNACWAVYFVTGAVLTGVVPGAPVTVDVLDVAVKVAALDVGVTTVSGVTADVVVCLAGCVALFWLTTDVPVAVGLLDVTATDCVVVADVTVLWSVCVEVAWLTCVDVLFALVLIGTWLTGLMLVLGWLAGRVAVAIWLVWICWCLSTVPAVVAGWVVVAEEAALAGVATELTGAWWVGAVAALECNRIVTCGWVIAGPWTVWWSFNLANGLTGVPIEWFPWGVEVDFWFGGVTGVGAFTCWGCPAGLLGCASAGLFSACRNLTVLLGFWDCPVVVVPDLDVVKVFPVLAWRGITVLVGVIKCWLWCEVGSVNLNGILLTETRICRPCGPRIWMYCPRVVRMGLPTRRWSWFIWRVLNWWVMISCSCRLVKIGSVVVWILNFAARLTGVLNCCLVKCLVSGITVRAAIQPLKRLPMMWK